MFTIVTPVMRNDFAYYPGDLFDFAYRKSPIACTNTHYQQPARTRNMITLISTHRNVQLAEQMKKLLRIVTSGIKFHSGCGGEVFFGVRVEKIENNVVRQNGQN